MDIRDVARLTMRVFSLYVAFRGLENIVLFIGASGAHINAGESSGLITSLLFIALGVVIWWAAGWLGNRALGSPDETVAEVRRTTAVDVHAVAFSVLGLYLVATGVVQVIVAVTLFVQAHTDKAPVGVPAQVFSASYIPQAERSLIMAIAYFVVGCVLIYGARSIALRVRRIWREGRGMLVAHTVEIVDLDDSTTARLTGDQLQFFDKDGNVVHRVP